MCCKKSIILLLFLWIATACEAAPNGREIVPGAELLRDTSKWAGRDVKFDGLLKSFQGQYYIYFPDAIPLDNRPPLLEINPENMKIDIACLEKIVFFIGRISEDAQSINITNAIYYEKDDGSLTVICWVNTSISHVKK